MKRQERGSGNEWKRGISIVVAELEAIALR